MSNIKTLLKTSFKDSKTFIKEFNKDKDNKLNEEECNIFLLDYEKYIKEDINKIYNPKTKSEINNLAKIEYIAKKCKQKLGLSDSNSGSDIDSLSLSPKDIKNHYKYIKKLNVNDILTILNLSDKNESERINNIKPFFTKRISNNNLLKILEGYIYDDSIEQEVSVNILKFIIKKIKKYIPNFSPFMDHITYSELIQDTFFSITHIDASFEKDIINPNNQTSNSLRILTNTKKLIDKIILYSENNETEEDYYNNIFEYQAEIYTYHFLLLKISEYYRGLGQRQFIKYSEFLNKLSRNEIIPISDATPSFEKSPNWSKTPTDRIELENYNDNKKRLLEIIMDDSNFSGGINDTDYYTLEKWEDMPLGKLRKVMVIPYEEDGKTYGIAYYVKSLYKAWYTSVKNKKDFVNPINKNPFTDKDKEDILECMKTIQPNLFAPKYGESGRKDIVVRYHTERVLEYDEEAIAVIYRGKKLRVIEIDFVFIKNHINLTYNYNLIKIKFPLTFTYIDDNSPEGETTLSLNYNPSHLYEIINNLSKKNKIVSESIPFKINDIFKRYNNKVLNKRSYISFFNELKEQLEEN